MEKVQQIEILFNLKKFEQSAELSRKLISEMPENEEGYLFLAFSLIMVKKFKEAHIAISQSPEN